MLQDGFTMLVRNSQTFENLIEKIVPQIDLQRTAFIYSQFGGYIDESHTAFRQSTYDFVHKHKSTLLVTHRAKHLRMFAIGFIRRRQLFPSTRKKIRTFQNYN